MPCKKKPIIKSEKQRGKLFAMEAQGELPPGTALRIAKRTKRLKGEEALTNKELPTKVSSVQKFEHVYKIAESLLQPESPELPKQISRLPKKTKPPVTSSPLEKVKIKPISTPRNTQLKAIFED